MTDEPPEVFALTHLLITAINGLEPWMVYFEVGDEDGHNGLAPEVHAGVASIVMATFRLLPVLIDAIEPHLPFEERMVLQERWGPLMSGITDLPEDLGPTEALRRLSPLLSPARK